MKEKFRLRMNGYSKDLPERTGENRTTIRNAQRIMVLTEEGITEEGTHEELIAKKGI